MALTAPAIDQDELLLESLSPIMVGDLAYYSAGNITPAEYDDLFGDLELAQGTITNKFLLLGELAEMPAKADSKSTKLKTRNYTIDGKRSSTVELTLNGLSALQKDYFEGPEFSGEEITVVLVPRGFMELDPYENSPKAVIFNGMRWTVDWSGEADVLWSVVISTELSGMTMDRIMPVQIPAGTEAE